MKNELFTIYNNLIKDKSKSLNFYIVNFLTKTLSMFDYLNLPDNLDKIKIEKILQKKGFGIFTRYNNDFIFVDCAGCGTTDIYGDFSKFIVTKPQINLNSEFENLKDCVLIKNNSFSTDLIQLIARWSSLLVDCDLSLNFAAVLTRLNVLISANDDFTKENADKYLEKIIKGDFGVIAENSFFDGVKMQTTTVNSNYITQLVELTQYIKATLYNELGLQSNCNMKRERLNVEEVQSTQDILLPYVDNMLFERQKSIKQINNLYGLNIEVTLKNAWKIEKENAEKIIENVNTVTKVEQETTNEKKETEKKENTENE